MITSRHFPKARSAAVLVTAALFTASISAQRIPLCGMRAVPSHSSNGAEHSLFVQPILPPADTQSVPTVIDVMFLYTPEALNGAGEEAAILRRIHQAVDEANYMLTNSEVNVSINPVYINLIQYTESGDISLDLDRLGGGRGEFAGVNALRNDYKADVVCLITEFENLGIGGLAWDIPPLRGNSSTAFLAIRRSQLGRNVVLAHELGHLLGCAHDREHVPGLDSTFWQVRRPYIFGYRLEVEGVTYIDVMAYEPGVSLPFYGNPRLNLDGVPLGIAEGESRPSDTARTINETAPYVAAYRQALSRIEFVSAAHDVLRAEGNLTLRLRRTGNIDNSTRVTASVSSNSTAQAGVDYTLPDVMTVQFDSGQDEATFNLPIVNNQTAETKTLRLFLGAPVGSHGIGLQGETTVFIRDHLPVVKVDPVFASENSGTVELKPTFTGPVLTEIPKITWHLEPGSATEGTDYIDQSGELKVNAGAGGYTIEPIRVQLVDDKVPEPDKVLKVVFEGTTQGSATYSAVTNEVHIMDDDRRGAVLDAPGATLNPDMNFAVAVRHDKKFLAWGGFSRLSATSRTGVALLNANGTVDTSFRPPSFMAGHRAIDHLPTAFISAVQPLAHGKFLVAGEFARADGKPKSTLARLNSDGSLDETFGSDLKFDGAVDALVLQPDGKILVGGTFEKVNGVRRAFIGRLNSDGTVDDSFTPNGGPTSTWTVQVRAIALQPDGKILIGGFFERVDGVDSLNFARLNPNGTMDTSFQATRVSGPVIAIKLQTDGKIVLTGLFDQIQDGEIHKLGRLNSDGSIDESFQPPMPNAEVRDAVTLPDRKLLIIGAFTRIGDTPCRFIALINEDGTLDTSFDLGSGPNERPGGLSIHADGSLYLSGLLEKVNGLAAPGIARVKFGPTGSAITNLRSGTAGEFSFGVSVFPGGVYPIVGSDDLSNWTEIGSVQAEGYSRESVVTLPSLGAHQFIRLKNPAN